VSAGVVAALIALLGAAPPSPAPLDALLAGLDSPPPVWGPALAPDERAALRAVALDATQPLLRRARALRLVVDGDLTALQAAATGELRIQVAWARVDRAARAGHVLAVALPLLAEDDPALRTVGALAAWREGSPAARRALAARLGVEHDDDVAMLLRARLARRPRRASSTAPPSSPSSPSLPVAPSPSPPGAVR